MILNMYTNKNETLQRYTAPFLCISHYTAMHNYKEMRGMLRDLAKDGIDAEITEMDKQEFALYYIGTFDTETAKIENEIPEKICDEKSVDHIIREWEDKNAKEIQDSL